MKRYHGRKNSQQNGSQQQVAKQDLYALILQDAVEAGICQQERTVIPSVAGSGILYGYILARSLYPRMQHVFCPLCVKQRSVRFFQPDPEFGIFQHQQRISAVHILMLGEANLLDIPFNNVI